MMGMMSEAIGTAPDDSAEPVSPEVTTESVVEAILLSTDVPLSGAKIAQLLGTGDAGDVRQHIDNLNDRYGKAGSSFRIEPIAKGYQLLTLPAYDHWVRRLQKSRADSRLSPVALETLAIVAYKQPVLRATVESIRGVAVGDMLVRLREMNLIRIVGRAEEIGRPLLYGTTSKFLKVFGLSSLKDLPQLDETTSPQTVPLLRPAANDMDETTGELPEPDSDDDIDDDTGDEPRDEIEENMRDETEGDTSNKTETDPADRSPV